MSVIEEPDFHALARVDDPHPAYHRLRTFEPVHWSPQLRGWVLTRYADAVELLRRSEFSADRVTPFLRDVPEQVRGAVDAFTRFVRPWILVLDPPDHTRIRSLMNRAFSARAVEALRPRIRGLVKELLAKRRDDRMDMIADLAYPLPATVIAEMLGVPMEDRDRFKAWSDDVAAFVGTFSIDADVIGRADRSLAHLQAFFRGLIEERRRRPGADLLSQLIAAKEDGKSLSEDELVANAAFLLFAGHETTTNLIGNGLFWLLRNPQELARLRAEPGLMASAVEEMLRYDPPVDRISRIAKTDTTIADRRIKAGERVIALTAAANRDPTQFPDPDRLDVGRTENRHLAFGIGAHFCLGGPLARVEAQETFAELLSTFPTMSLDQSKGEWVDSLGFRGLHGLKVRTGR